LFSISKKYYNFKIGFAKWQIITNISVNIRLKKEVFNQKLTFLINPKLRA